MNVTSIDNRSGLDHVVNGAGSRGAGRYLRGALSAGSLCPDDAYVDRSRVDGLERGADTVGTFRIVRLVGAVCGSR